MNRRVTHQDIAKSLGVDKSTVSLALRGHPRISAATIERVKAMAKLLGYRPDPALAILARQRWAGHETGSGAELAYLVDSRMSCFDIHRRFFAFARQRAEQRGYYLIEFDLADYRRSRSLSRVLRARSIRGILVPEFSSESDVEPSLLSGGEFTVVCLDHGWLELPFHQVSANIFAATQMVWREVHSRGFRRIGGALLSHSPRAVDDWARYGGSAAALEELIPPDERIPLLSSSISDFQSFKDWLHRYEPEVVIGFIPMVREWMVRAGRRVPDDISFAALMVDHAKHLDVSGYATQDEEIGHAGIDALTTAMLANEWGPPSLPRQIMLTPRWYEGSTLPPRAPGSTVKR